MLKKVLKNGKLKIWSLYKDQARREHVLNYLFWECTLNCNFFCEHCGSNAGKKVHDDELTTEEIKKTFKDVADKYDASKIMIAVTGGEPMLRPDLFEVMDYANNLGFPWGMVTNGYLVDEQAVQNMKKSGMKTVVVSIDGLGETHDKFRNVEGAYKKAINAVNLLVKENFLDKIQITTSVSKKNYNELEKMYDVLTPLGITSWRVMNIDPIGRSEDNEILLDDNQLKGLLDFIKEKRKKSKKVNITYGCAGFLGENYEGEVRDNFFFCNTGINVGSILHKGDIYVCPNVPRIPELVQGNVKNQNFTDIWENNFLEFRKKDRTNCENCSSCEKWEDCLGSSYHLWDFNNQKPKFCHYKILK